MLVLLLAAAAPLTSVPGSWSLSLRSDPVDDTSQIWAVIGDQNRHVAIGCDKGFGNKLQLVIETGTYLGAEKRGILLGGRDITLRFDDNPPLKWRAEYEDRGVIEDKQEFVSNVISQARGSRRLVVRATNYEGDDIDLLFNYPDPSLVIQQALQLCATESRPSERPDAPH